MADTPTGIVTFLFTGIEGSTALHENHPTQMRVVLERHDEIFKSNVEAKGGYVFATGDDAFSVAFNTPIEALEAVLAIQRALLAEEWPENVEVPVRMGLHSGRAEERDGNFFGTQVDRAARLTSAGHGGQVLLSDATYNLVRDELVHLEPEAELRYLGEHRLKDLRHNERIFQLIVHDLPASFPPLDTDGLVTPLELVNLDLRYGRAEWIGGGGFADVYLVHHEALDKDMALKVMKNQVAKNERFVELFRREAKIAAKLSHPNIVAVNDAGEGIFEGQKVFYIAMEYVSGGTLRELIRRQEGLLSPRVAVEHAMRVAEALEAAHQSELIHRDIKPENILLTESGFPKVADFGIARAVSATVAATSSLIGTAPYISPEQAKGEPATFQSDLYSLGIVLYEMLTGKVPYDAETPLGIVYKHIGEPLRPPKEVNPNVPEGINEVCVRLLAKTSTRGTEMLLRS